jgi:hypothetical protein
VFSFSSKNLAPMGDEELYRLLVFVRARLDTVQDKCGCHPGCRSKTDFSMRANVPAGDAGERQNASPRLKTSES